MQVDFKINVIYISPNRYKFLSDIVITMIHNIIKSLMSCVSVLLLLALTASSGCNKKKVQLTGNRESVLTKFEKEEILDLTRPLSPISELSISDWNQSNGNSEVRSFNLKLSQITKPMKAKIIADIGSNKFGYIATPVIVENKLLFVTTLNIIKSIDITSGKVEWENKEFFNKKSSDNNHNGGGILYKNGIAFMTFGSNKVAAINTSDGKTLWSQNISGLTRSIPLIINNTVVIQTVDGILYILNIENGDVISTYMVDKLNDPSLLATTNIIGDDASNNIIIQSANNQILSVNSATGELVWEQFIASSKLKLHSHNYGNYRSLLVDQNILYAIASDGTIAALNISSGNIVWKLELDAVKPIWIAGDLGFTINRYNQLIAFYKNDGKLRWKTTLDNSDKTKCWSEPIVAGGNVILTDDLGNITTFSYDDGSIKSIIKLENKLSCSIPFIANDTLYTILKNGRVAKL